MTTVLPYLLYFGTLCLSLWASAHAVLSKRDSRAAAFWVGLIWFLPLVGCCLYVWLGINRIERRARTLRSTSKSVSLQTVPEQAVPSRISTILDASHAHLAGLVELVSKATNEVLTDGNSIVPLNGGDEAYAEMLESIRTAKSTISFSTYIFDSDQAGDLFVDALSEAVQRGVEVRVLIDDVGSRYSWPSPVRRLLHRGVRTSRFNPTHIPWRFHYSNLRNHRKIMVVDGCVGFTGGMNIRGECLWKSKPSYEIADLHFRVCGPVVTQLQTAFLQDWRFATGEELVGEGWFPQITSKGPMLARGIADGPDENTDQLRLVLLGALDCAMQSVKIVTPYFLPDGNLISALNVAAMRGVEIDIIVPAQTNLRFVQWAMAATLNQVLERGCRVWGSAAPFDHSKFVVVDGLWVMLGSSNWDARSLRLNFEFNVECYSLDLAGKMNELFEVKRAHSHPITIDQINNRNLAVRLRDGIARLATPFL